MVARPRKAPHIAQEQEDPGDDRLWVQTLADRIDAYRQDLIASALPPEETSDRIPEAVKHRGQGVTYEPDAAPSSQALELMNLRFGGALATSFIPQRHVGFVDGRPVVVTLVTSIYPSTMLFVVGPMCLSTRPPSHYKCFLHVQWVGACRPAHESLSNNINVLRYFLRQL